MIAKLSFLFSKETVEMVSIQKVAGQSTVRLYEARQSLANPYFSAGRGKNKTPNSVSLYVQRWFKWVRSGLDDYALDRKAALS